MIEILRADHVRMESSNGDILQNLNLNVREGEVHGLIGDYGISHSLLCQLCAGTQSPDSGQIYYYDKPVGSLSFAESRQKGIYTIANGQNLLENMTALENIYLIARNHFGWLCRRKQIACLVSEYLDFFGIPFSLQASVGDLSVLQSCIVSMIGAIIADARLFILDEVTAAMNEQDSLAFQRVLSCLKYKGFTVICMVHRIDELVRYTDRATLIKNGSTVRCIDKTDYSYDKMLAMLLI